MRWLYHTPTYSMKERAHTVAVEAETVPVTVGLRHRHQSGNVDVVSFHFVNLTIVLHHSNKKDIGVAFQERKTQVLGPQGGNGYLACYRTQQEISQIRTGQDRTT
jgi:hypothetical protein